MSADGRTKYDVSVAVKNGQAFNLVTHMPLEAIEQEIAKAREEARFAKFDAINPYTDNKVSVRIDATEIIGLVYYEWTRPQGKPTAPSLLQ